jgi:hypothetical protein
MRKARASDFRTQRLQNRQFPTAFRRVLKRCEQGLEPGRICRGGAQGKARGRKMKSAGRPCVAPRFGPSLLA